MSGFPHLSLVLGGASSGKSRFAEGLVTDAGLPRVYVATAQAFDKEMAAKIFQHQVDRGPDWQTIEAPMDVPDVLGQVEPGKVVLVDCLTLWLSNLLLEERDLIDENTRLMTALGACACPVVCVSNEVGMGVVPDTSLGRRFRSAQGGLNQLIATKADVVVQVTAGLPMVLKGLLP